MLQVIQRVGTALPIYIDRLPALLAAGSSLVAVDGSFSPAFGLGHPSGLCLLVLHSSLSTAASLKPSALAILAACVEAAPGALGSTLSSLVEACLDILRCAGRPVEGSVSPDGSRCRADKTTDDDACGPEEDPCGPEEDPCGPEQDPCGPEEDEEGEPLPIVSPVYGVHHHWTLVRAALLFIQTLLSQTLALCLEAQSSPKSLALLATMRANIAHHLPHIHTVLSYLQLPAPPSDPRSSPVAPPTSHPIPSPDQPLPTPKSSPLVAASLLHNALQSLAVLRSVFAS